MKLIKKYKGGGAAILEFLSPAFKKAAQNGNQQAGKMILNTWWIHKTGQAPVQLYHGTINDFNYFDPQVLGQNTGQGHFIEKDGTILPFDSERAFMLTTHNPTAANYGFLGLENKLINLEERAIKGTPFSEEDIKWIQRFPELKRAWEAQDKDAFIKAFRNYSTARSVSNQYNNYTNQQANLQVLQNNIDRIILGDKSVKFHHGPLTTHDVHFFDSPSGKQFALFTGGDGKLKFRFNDVIKDASSIKNPQSVLDWAKDVHRGGVQGFLKEQQDFINNIRIMPLYVNAKNPLIHDYRGSAFPDKYINEKGVTKYPTDYVAARQVRRALQDGNDAVIYENIRDPFLGNTYGIFNPNLIKSSEPFTYDEEGNLIPIEERFNFNKNSILHKKGGKCVMYKV